MKYANITLDIGAAINAFKVLWSYPDKFKNIVIRLGDFHYIKEIFAILGQLVSGSGFENIIFQAGLCSAGSLNGVVSGYHYNRCWTVHNNLTKALERLLFERFLSAVDNLRDLVDNFSDRLDLNYQSIEEHFQDALEDDGIGEHLKAYSQFQEAVRNGVYGKTSQFWMLYYLDIMRNQHLIQESVHTNNFFLQLHGLKAMLPFMFALNKQNYARYRSIYVNTLENLYITHPRCHELLERNGLSV